MKKHLLSDKELVKLLKVGDSRTINKYIKDGIIKIESNINDEKMFDRDLLYKTLGIKSNIDSKNIKFLTIREAAKYLNRSRRYIELLIINNKLPYYKLNNVNKSKYLIRKKDLKLMVDYHIQPVNRSYRNASRLAIFIMIFENCYNALSSKDKLQFDILYQYLVKCKNSILLAAEQNVSPEYIRLKISEQRSKFFKLFKSNYINNDILVNENKKLTELNKLLKYNFKNKNSVDRDIHYLSLTDFDFSTRVINVFNNNELYTVGDLLRFGIDNINKLRNIGVKSVSEIKEFILKYNLL